MCICQNIALLLIYKSDSNLHSVLPLHFFHLMMSVEKWRRALNTQFTEKVIQIAHKHMKGCSTSFIIRKIQIKSTQRDCFSPIRLAKIQKSDNTLCWQGCRTSCTPVSVGGSGNWHNPREGNWTISIKVRNAYCLLKTYPSDNFAQVQNDICCDHV